ncbi:tetratricopeptide repeat protein [Sphaerisporangium flaviroseum]|uniref:tetratricopeptide repeat protein n=1 Tax=Sphaerisporangium flaviroseum TaxID=509199 RepID=UPI0031E9BCBC
MTRTQVYGHLVQINQVEGNVTVRLGQMDPAPERDVQQIIEGDIPQQPRGFQLREELLERLHGQVAATGAAVVSAVTGKPGVGKTMLAAAYAWSCQAAGWPVVAWIAAETGDQIQTGLAGLAERLRLRQADDDATTAAKRARDWLAATHWPSLVVFDNAVDVEQVRAWCPATGATRMIITSRNRAFERSYAQVPVEEFTPDQAEAFLRERTGLNDQAAGELAAELGHLPLALAQAAALIVRRHLNYADYLRLLRAFPLDRYLPAQVGDQYPTGTAQAILLALVQAEEARPAARRMLEMLAVLSPAGIPRPILYGTRGLAESGDLAEQAEIVRGQIDEELAELADTSLISFTEDGSTVLMHRLVQRVLRENAQHENRLNAALSDATALLYRFNDALPEGHATWAARPAVEMLMGQTTALHTIAHCKDALTDKLLDLRASCGRYLIHLADLGRAIPLLEQTLAEREQVLGHDHPDTLVSRNNLAQAYQAAGDLGRAIPLLEQTLAECERILGDDRPFTLISRNNLANAYQLAGDPGRAISMLGQALAKQERILGDDHPNTLVSRNNLASAYEAAGDLRRAIPMYKQTLAECERVLGDDHPDTLSTLSNLAHAYQAAGDLRRAIRLYKHGLAKQERILGDDHPDTLASRNNLAHAYHAAGALGEAIPLLEQTLAKQELILGDNHPNTLLLRNNLAQAYQAAGDLRRAIPLLEQSLAKQERILDDDHPDTLVSRNNLASAYEAAWDLGRAVRLYKQTLARCERVLGGNHPYTLLLRNNLAGAYATAGNLSRAIPMYEQTLAERERVLGGDHPDTLTTRNNLAGAYESAGDLGRAIPMYERTLTGREQVQGGDHPDTLVSRNNLAHAYESAGILRHAVRMYKQTLADCERVLGGDHPITRAVRGNLQRVQ